MKILKIELIPTPAEASQAEPVYHVTVDGEPVIGLSDSEGEIVLPLNNSQQRTYLLRTLDPERLARFKKALEKD